MAKTESRKEKLEWRMFNQSNQTGPVELSTENKNIGTLRITNIITPVSTLEIDLYMESIYDNSIQYYIAKKLFINIGASVQFEDGDIYLPTEHKLIIEDSGGVLTNAYSVQYTLKNHE